MKTYVVMSDARFIGRAVIAALRGAGHQVLLVTPERLKAPLGDAVEVVVGPRAQLSAVITALEARGEPLGGVVDVDAWTGADARAVIDAVPARDDLPVVVLSSVDVYRAFECLLDNRVEEAVPLTEESRLRRRSQVFSDVDPSRAAMEHLDVEAAYRGSRLSPTILRLPVVYGPGDERRREWPWIRRVLDGRATLPMGQGWVGWAISRAHVGDVAHGVMLALTGGDAARGEIFNIAEPSCLPWGALARTVCALAGGEVQVVPVPDEALPEHLNPGPHAPQPLLIGSQKIRRVLGYAELQSPAARLKATVAWHLAHPPSLDDVDDLPDYAAEERLLQSLADPSPA